jgi:hypothetical protein
MYIHIELLYIMKPHFYYGARKQMCCSIGRGSQIQLIRDNAMINDKFKQYLRLL